MGIPIADLPSDAHVQSEARVQDDPESGLDGGVIAEQLAAQLGNGQIDRRR